MDSLIDTDLTLPQAASLPNGGSKRCSAAKPATFSMLLVLPHGGLQRRQWRGEPDGTVKGIAALRVADASIMPSDCRANTHFTTVVIGEAIARMMMRKTDVSNNAAALAM